VHFDDHLHFIVPKLNRTLTKVNNNRERRRVPPRKEVILSFSPQIIITVYRPPFRDSVFLSKTTISESRRAESVITDLPSHIGSVRPGSGRQQIAASVRRQEMRRPRKLAAISTLMRRRRFIHKRRKYTIRGHFDRWSAQSWTRLSAIHIYQGSLEWQHAFNSF
jgi:hypothetical protein